MKSLARACLPLLGLFVSPGSVSAQDAEEALGGLVERLERAVAEDEVTGAVVWVGRGEQTLLHAAYGQRVAGPGGAPMTRDTIFDLASLTKGVATASCAQRLIERGVLDLNSRVATHLPAFAAEGKQDVTVLDLLLHRSGLPPIVATQAFAEGPAAGFAALEALAPRERPGTRFLYSDCGFLVLAHLLERVDGRPLERLFAEEVAAPLGMTSTRFRPTPEQQARCAPTENDEAGRMLQGVVHDPRARALDGVAGHAGLFGTAEDLARWCRALLAEGGGWLTPESVASMTRPRRSGSALRALGLDVDSPYSSVRGRRFPRGSSFGHTGFTGTSLWLDPASEVFVVLLTSRLHGGSGSVRTLRADVADAVAEALLPTAGAAPEAPVRSGVDVLVGSEFEALRGQQVGLVTNITGRASDGARTLDLLARTEACELVRVFSPEHGLFARLEGDVADSTDPLSGLDIVSLYGDSRRPSPEHLAGLDSVVFDIQDVGVRYYTYATTLGYLMEEAGKAGVRVVVLDRPNPLGGELVDGPCTDPQRRSFIAYQSIPVVHGMTLGELARMYVGAFGVECELTVVPCEGWQRAMHFDDTGMRWIDPSPNMRNVTQALLYPITGLLEGANLSVGRGTDQPFERIGAPWIDGPRLAAALREHALPGLTFTPIEFTPTTSKFEGELCEGLYLRVTDARALDPVRSGLTIAHCLREHGRELELGRVDARMLCDRVWRRWLAASSPSEVAGLGASWSAEVAAFREARRPYLLYR